MKLFLYPEEWSTLAREIKEANHWRCQACQKQCRRPGEMWLGWDYEMACAHICQDYEGESVCVAAVCARCHLLMDAPFVWVARRRRQRLRQQLAGQLSLTLKTG